MEMILENFYTIDEDMIDLISYSQKLFPGSIDSDEDIAEKLEKYATQLVSVATGLTSNILSRFLDFILGESNLDKGFEKYYTVLHKAVEEGNTLTVNILLDYFSRINRNTSWKIKDIFHELVDYKAFLIYLERMPI